MLALAFLLQALPEGLALYCLAVCLQPHHKSSDPQADTQEQRYRWSELPLVIRSSRTIWQGNLLTSLGAELAVEL